MTRAISSEWLKVRRTEILLPAFVVTVILAVTGPIVGLHELDRPRAKANVTLYSQANGFGAILQHSTDFLLIVGLGFAAFAFSMEFSSGTLRNLLVRQPGRLRLFAGKTIVVFALIAAFVGVCYVCAFPAAIVTAPHYGVSTAAWTSSSGIKAFFSGGANLIGSTLGYSALGALLGVVLRSPAPAIVAGLAYVYGVEALLTNSFTSLGNALLASQLDAIAHGGTVDVGYWSAVVVALAWVAGLVLLGGYDLRRRDVRS